MPGAILVIRRSEQLHLVRPGPVHPRVRVRRPRVRTATPGTTWTSRPAASTRASPTQGFRRSPDLLHEFVDGAVDAYDLDPDRVGLLGFSQGAITSLSALLERPDAYRWVVALNGSLAAEHEDDADAAASKPVFVGCGAMDRIIPPERAERAADRLVDAGAEVRFERYGVGHGTTPEEVTDVVAWVDERF